LAKEGVGGWFEITGDSSMLLEAELIRDLGAEVEG